MNTLRFHMLYKHYEKSIGLVAVEQTIAGDNFMSWTIGDKLIY